MRDEFDDHMRLLGKGEHNFDDTIVKINDMEIMYLCNKTKNVHRENGPAHIVVGNHESWFCDWYVNDIKHRLDGPASVDNLYEDWYIHGTKATNKIHQWAKQQGINLKKMSNDDRTLLKLVWGDYGK